MTKLAPPQKINEFGWFVAEDVAEGFFADYLHPDGDMYPSMNDLNGKQTGYFQTELAAYKAIHNFYTRDL